MDIIYWNVYIGQNPNKVLTTVRELAEKHRPEVIGLGEATKAYQITDDVPGYRRYHLRRIFKRGNENADTAILVRNDIKVTSRRSWRMGLSWFVPRRTVKHTPRVYLIVKFKDEGVKWRVAVGHWPFGAAQEETKRKVKRWMLRYPRTRSIFVGDLNARREEINALFKGTRVRNIGVGVDRAIYQNCNASCKKLGKFGSDHHAVKFTFKVK